MEPGISQQLRAPLRQRLVRAAGQVPFLETDRFEHVRGNCDVLGLSGVRCACQRQLIVSPADRVRNPRCDERRRLHRLGTGPPGSQERRITRQANQLAALVHHGGMYAVTGFENRASRRYNVELVTHRASRT